MEKSINDILLALILAVWRSCRVQRNFFIFIFIFCKMTIAHEKAKHNKNAHISPRNVCKTIKKHI